MGKTFKDGASAKYKRKIVSEEELPIEFILGKLKQNIKKSTSYKGKKSYKEVNKDEVLEE